MAWHKLIHISLARKCQLLFGLAVLLILATALFVPGYYMESFIHALNAQRTRELARIARARINPSNPDWTEQQRLLDQWWTDNAAKLSLPANSRPQLLALPWETGEDILPIWLRLVRLPEDPPAWLRHTLDVAEAIADASLTCQCVKVGYHLLPENTRARLVARGRRLVPRTPPDEFQRDAIKEMLADDKKNETETTVHEGSQPREYRCIVAVRGVEDVAGRRPLVGVIDVRRAAPETDEMILLSRAILVLAGVLAGFLAVLVFYLITQKLILAPVRELTELSERIAGGDMSARANLSTGDEFEELSDAFNDMLGRLEKSRVELETINKSLDTKLGELAETNVALYESNRLKTEFLANVSHELRTPLTSIIGFADLLRDGASGEVAIDKTRLARYAHNILISGRGLLDIINDLLDLAKIEAGRIELHRSTFSVRDVCEALHDLTRPLFDKKNLKFEMEVPDDMPLVHSDAGKIRQILYNLLSNAIKYTPEGGEVRLEAYTLAGGHRIRLAVTDTGPGIGPEHRDQIFEKFRQLDASVTREHSGTGLGLAITRELCLMLGGGIALDSELGKGSRFIVELPVECPEATPRKLPALS